MKAAILARLRYLIAFIASCIPVPGEGDPLPPLEWTHVLPGDAIIVNLPPALTDARRADMLAQLARAKVHLPEGVRFIVADASVTLSVVRGGTQ